MACVKLLPPWSVESFRKTRKNVFRLRFKSSTFHPNCRGLGPFFRFYSQVGWHCEWTAVSKVPIVHPPDDKSFLFYFIFNLLTVRINTLYGLIWWCRTNFISPSSGRIRTSLAKRPLLLHLRSIGKRRFSLRLFCFSRSGCRSMLGCTSKRSWCLVLLSYLMINEVT